MKSSITALLAGVSLMIAAQGANATQITDLVGRYVGTNYGQSHACALEIKRINNATREPLIEVTVDESYEIQGKTYHDVLKFPAVPASLIDRAIKTGYSGQILVQGASGYTEDGYPYSYELSGGTFNDGRLNYMGINYNENRGLYQGGMISRGCSHLTKL